MTGAPAKPTPARLADSAFCPAARGKSGRESTPSLALCSLPIATPRCGDAQAYEPRRAHVSHRKIGRTAGQPDAAYKSASDCRPGQASLALSADTLRPCAGCCGRTLIGSRGRFSRNILESSASGSRDQRSAVNQTPSRTVGNDDAAAQLSSSATSAAWLGRFLCRTSRWLSGAEKASRSSRSVFVVSA